MEQGSSSGSSDNPLAARRVGGLHDFVVPEVSPLDRDAELECVDAIERGRIALETIAGPIESELAAYAASCDQSLIPTKTIQIVVAGVVREQIGKQATLDRSPVAVGSAIAGGLQTRFRQRTYGGVVQPDRTLKDVIDQLFPEAHLKVVFSEALGTHSLWDDVAGREKAIAALVSSHYRIAKLIARRAMRQRSEYEDLLSEAFFILRQAAILFDGETGFRFSTYATAALNRDLKRRSPTTIGLSRYTRGQLREFEMVAASMAQERLGRAPPSDVFDELAFTARTRTMIENARCLLAAQRRHPDRGTPLLPEAIELNVKPVYQDVFNRDACQRIRAACSALTLKEKRLIVRHYFLCQSTRDLAERFGMSPQAIRRSLANAHAKLASWLKSH